MLVERTSLKLDDVVIAYRSTGECANDVERQQRRQEPWHICGGAEFVQGEQWSMGTGGRLNSWSRDMSNVECYYCGENNHI